jgi:hypothetical protein
VTVNRKRLTKSQFILNSVQVHGDKYDYSKSTIVDSNTRTIVICPLHGDFDVVPRNHYNTQKTACPKCKNYMKGSLDLFLKRACEAHGNKYDYSKVDFVSNNKKVVVNCLKHGEFQVVPSQHYLPRAIGCSLCSNKKANNTEGFIKQAVEIHGSKYSYDKVNYSRNDVDVTIVCPKHGEFYIRPSGHIGKERRGCPSCVAKVARGKLDTSRFVELSKAVHGDKYDYSNSNYVNATKKISILCVKHGEFEIRPNAHFGSQKQGCPACGGRGKVTTSSFIEKSKKIFDDKFSYDHAVYVNAHTPLIITCNLHGDFSIRPSNHLNSRGGCKVCGKRSDISTQDFIELLKIRFGEKFDYSSVEYKGQNTLITVVCPEHGDFKRKPGSLLRLVDCPKCSEYTQEIFILAANKIHDNQYNYDKVDYIKSTEYVTISCMKHGEFQQAPSGHLSGRGCPTCGIEKNLLSNRDPDSPAILYYLCMEYKGHKFWKIGITTKSIDIRYKLLPKDNVTIKERVQIETTIEKAIQIESWVIQKFDADLEYRGHILKHAKGGTECFGRNVLFESSITLDQLINKLN